MRHLSGQMVLTLFLSVAGACAQAPNTPDAASADASRAKAAAIVSRMLAKNRERLAALDRYSSDRTYQVEYSGTGGEHHAEIKVHAEYTGPDP